MFMYVIGKEGEKISYDEAFKNYGTIEYIETKGGTTTTGHFKTCTASDFTQFMSLPGLKGISAANLLCPSIEISKEIQQGDIEI